MSCYKHSLLLLLLSSFWISQLLLQPVTAGLLDSLLGRKSTSNDDADGKKEVSDSKAKDYLQKFGYIAPSSQLGAHSGMAGDLASAKQLLKSAVKKFQEFAGLTPTGVLDSKTKRKMAQPRCGMLDVAALSSFGSGAAFKWPKSDLTYSITSYSPQLSHDVIRKAIRKAYDTWSAVVPLRFREVPSSDESADIKVKFARGAHGDPWPFDGRGGVLAHATMPTSGLLHFDEDEHWTYMDAEQIAQRHFTDLLPVAIHESGHTLGLEHSRDQRAIMAPFYRATVDSWGNYVVPRLAPSDVAAIQQIYGVGQRRKWKKPRRKKPGRWRHRGHSHLGEGSGGGGGGGGLFGKLLNKWMSGSALGGGAGGGSSFSSATSKYSHHFRGEGGHAYAGHESGGSSGGGGGFGSLLGKVLKKAFKKKHEQR